MTRSILPSLAIAAVLYTCAAAPAAGGEAFQIISAGKSTVTPSAKKSGRSREPGTLAGRPRSPRKAWPSKIEVPSLIKERR